MFCSYVRVCVRYSTVNNFTHLHMHASDSCKYHATIGLHQQVRRLPLPVLLQLVATVWRQRITYSRSDYAR